MIQRRHGPRFAFESLGELLLRYFNRHRAIQPCIAGLIHLAYPSRADECEDFALTARKAGTSAREIRLGVQVWNTREVAPLNFFQEISGSPRHGNSPGTRHPAENRAKGTMASSHAIKRFCRAFNIFHAAAFR
jgi:hypothetical protein